MWRGDAPGIVEDNTISFEVVSTAFNECPGAGTIGRLIDNSQLGGCRVWNKASVIQIASQMVRLIIIIIIKRSTKFTKL